MDLQSAMREALADLDVERVRKLWAHIAPGLPQPKNDEETLVAIHHARTQTTSLQFKLRAWSHRWLLDHGYPSGLPDELKPRAERVYPRVVSAVGISVNGPDLLRGLLDEVHASMVDAVENCYADGKTEPSFVRARMFAAREQALKHR